MPLGIMQGYFLKVLGSYRSHIYPAPPPGMLSTALGPPSPHSSAMATGGGGTRPLSGLARVSLPARMPLTSSLACQAADDCPPDAIRGSSYFFDHAGLVASHRRNDKARAFLQHLRQSQLYEVFIQERLAIAAACGYDAACALAPGESLVLPEEEQDASGGWDECGDPWEERVSAYLLNRSRRVMARLGTGARGTSFMQFQAFVRKHRRTDGASESDLSRAKQLAAAFMQLGGQRAGGGGGLGAAGTARQSVTADGCSNGGAIEPAAGASWGNLQQLLSASSNQQQQQSGTPLAARGWHTHSMSVDQLGLAWAANGGATGKLAAGNSFTAGVGGAGAGAGGEVSGGASTPGSVMSEAAAGAVFDPSVFFEEDEEEVDEQDAMQAVAAAERGGGRLSRNASASSLSSLGSLSSGPSFTAGAGASFSASALRSRPSFHRPPPASSGSISGTAGAAAVPHQQPAHHLMPQQQQQHQHQQQSLVKQTVPRFGESGENGKDSRSASAAGAGRGSTAANSGGSSPQHSSQRQHHQPTGPHGTLPFPKPPTAFAASLRNALQTGRGVMMGSGAGAAGVGRAAAAATAALSQPPAPRTSLHVSSGGMRPPAVAGGAGAGAAAAAAAAGADVQALHHQQQQQRDRVAAGQTGSLADGVPSKVALGTGHMSDRGLVDSPLSVANGEGSLIGVGDAAADSCGSSGDGGRGDAGGEVDPFAVLAAARGSITA